MPGKNTIKHYANNNYYHVYNRGVEKRRIFEDREDYQTFLKYLELYLSPISVLTTLKPPPKLNILNHNVSDEVELVCFCLMPNHFHLIFKQITSEGITKLMRQISTAYSMYFNKRYQRVGPLFQGIYKAIEIDSDEKLIHLSRYIHRNPLERGASLKDFQWSSYTYYALGNPPVWLETQPILSHFPKDGSKNYEQFIETNEDKIDSNIDISSLLLES